MKTKSVKRRAKKLKSVEAHKTNGVAHSSNGHGTTAASHKNGSHKTNGVHKPNGFHKNGSHKANGVSHKKNGTQKVEHRIPNGVVVVEESPLITDLELIKILVKVKNGDFSVRLPEGQIGVKKAICDT